MPEEKPFDPTPARLARARHEGDVPHSRDVATVASFAGAGLALCATFGMLAIGAANALRSAARGEFAYAPYIVMSASVVALITCAAGGAAVATTLETRGIAFRFPKLDLKKLDPVSGLKRMFGRDAALGAAKALVVATTVTAVVASSAGAVLGIGATSLEPATLASVVARSVVSAAAGATALAAAFAAVDVLVERLKWRRRLRMSFDELKRDHKQSEGDPLLRGRRRQAHRNLIRGSIGRVKDAAFVVANPTHVAIALEYRPPAIPVPCVLVRAIDAGARAVRERARSLGIPIVQDVALARALLASTDVGDPIPRDAYGAVALIVATLLREKTLAP